MFFSNGFFSWTFDLSGVVNRISRVFLINVFQGSHCASNTQKMKIVINEFQAIELFRYSFQTSEKV